MSTQPVPALVSQPEPPKEIPELTDAYRKAHKNYVLASGLLASWELIGITLQTKEKWGIELKSPAAVPLILFTLVIYSGYKMTIEWLQCNPDRQQHPAAKWDYRIAHIIALTAIAISVVQYLLHIQIVDVLGHHAFILRTAFLVLYLGILAVIFFGKHTYPSKRPALFLSLTMLMAIVFALDAIARRKPWFLIGAAALAGVTLFLAWPLYRLRSKSKESLPRNSAQSTRA